MRNVNRHIVWFVVTIGAAIVVSPWRSMADPPAPVLPPAVTVPSTPQASAPTRPPVVSPEVLPDRRVVFRLEAPKATDVGVNTEFRLGQTTTPLQKDDNGVWSVTFGPVDPGAYRYLFIVNGVNAVDPINPATSECHHNVKSLVFVPGSDVSDVQNVPHGAVATVWYPSASGPTRRMHVYTPPGYESGKGRYPVLYLLHGSYDSDDAWSTVGCAGSILDNLIASGKANPMIVVMPFGYIAGTDLKSAFAADFESSTVPYVESHYRVQADQKHRAIAGLSMGGQHTLMITMAHPDQFGYVGVFSAGWWDSDEHVEANFGTQLDDKGAWRGLRLFWTAWGSDDTVAGPTNKSMVDILTRHGFNVTSHVSAGGHTWSNWREYLYEVAPLLFR